MEILVCSLPSEQARRQATFGQVVERDVRCAVTGFIEKALELLLQNHLQAGWNQRTDGRRGWRNGYYHRHLSTPYGPLRIRVPRPRQGAFDVSLVFDRYRRRLPDVERIIRHTYLLGVGTRGLAGLAEQIFGGRFSHQCISLLMRWLDEQLAPWRKQPIELVYPVVYIDGMHVDRLGGDRVVMLVTGQRNDGVMHVLGFCVSAGEDCLALLEDLRRRGLDAVRLFVSDDSPAIHAALEQVYPLVDWQSCSFHRLSRLRAAVGATAYRDRMLAEAACVFRCPSLGAALDVAAAWRVRWASVCPAAVYQFLYGLRNSLTFYELPQRWWKRVHTNNPMERLIRTLRQRLRPMGCFHDDPAIERAVFGQLRRWNKIKLTHNT